MTNAVMCTTHDGISHVRLGRGRNAKTAVTRKEHMRDRRMDRLTDQLTDQLTDRRSDL